MVQTSLVKIRDGSFKFMLLVLYVETGLLKSSDQFGHIDLRLGPPVHVSAAAAASMVSYGLRRVRRVSALVAHVPSA